MLDTEVHNDLREMMTRQINNTAADRRRCPSRVAGATADNDVISFSRWPGCSAEMYNFYVQQLRVRQSRLTNR